MAFGNGLSIGNIITGLIVIIVLVSILTPGITRYDGSAFATNITRQSNVTQNQFFSSVFNPINKTLTGNSTGFNTQLTGGVFSSFAFIVNGFGAIFNALVNAPRILTQLTSTFLLAFGIPQVEAVIIPRMLVSLLIMFVLYQGFIIWSKAGSWS